MHKIHHDVLKIILKRNILGVGSEFLEEEKTKNEITTSEREEIQTKIANFSKKTPWSPHEDILLKDLVENSDMNTDGSYKWTEIAASMGDRSGKQCRERWHNHLRPNLKKGNWTDEEDKLIVELQSKYGNQ